MSAARTVEDGTQRFYSDNVDSEAYDGPTPCDKWLSIPVRLAHVPIVGASVPGSEATSSRTSARELSAPVSHPTGRVGPRRTRAAPPPQRERARSSHLRPRTTPNAAAMCFCSDVAILPIIVCMIQISAPGLGKGHQIAIMT